MNIGCSCTVIVVTLTRSRAALEGRVEALLFSFSVFMTIGIERMKQARNQFW